MTEPTSALSYEDLVLVVAEQLQIANYDTTNGTIVIPVDDKYHFDLCQRIVNNGIRMFIADGPAKGWRWMRRIHSLTMAVTYTGTATGGTAATLIDSGIADEYDDDYFNGYTIYIKSGTGAGEYATVTDYTGSSGTFAFTALSGGSTPDTTSVYTIARSTLAINGDGARYLLPEDFGGTVDGKITYAADSGHATPIEWVDEAEIRDLRSGSVTSGYPMCAAVRPYSPTSSALATNRRWELILDPEPSSAQTIEFPYTMYFDKMKMRGGTATSAGATGLADTSRTEPDDFFNGWIIKVVHGTGKFSYATVTDYAKSTGAFTVTDWLDENGGAGGTDPGTGSLYIVQPAANIHPAGFRFDDAIMASCLARAQMETQDAGTEWIEYYNKVALPKAKELDIRSAPRRLGPMTNGPQRRQFRTWNGVTTDHDV